MVSYKRSFLFCYGVWRCFYAKIIKSEIEADLRNNYNEISTFCHNYPEPVFITKNGKGDLAVMSIEAYEELTSRFELYSQIKEGMDDIATGNIRPFSEAMADIRSRRSR